MPPQLHCTVVKNQNKTLLAILSSLANLIRTVSRRRRVFQVALFVHIVLLFTCITASDGLPSYESIDSVLCPVVSKIPYVGFNNTAQCFVWSESTPSEMCALTPEDRVRRLRSTFLFPDLQPISLFSVFSAGSYNEDWFRQLLTGVRGSDCVRERGKRCNACFDRLASALRRLDDAYRSFDQTLFRFDCMLAVDTASATRPFSPNGSCTTCRSWYKRWLLVHTVSIWREPPCVNWCYYAQLACPHLATSKVVDYAGHPSFQCRDLDIPLPQEPEKTSRCSCVHPCDLRGMVVYGDLANQHTSAHDFYPSRQHCEFRWRQCSRTTAHDRRVLRLVSSSSMIAQYRYLVAIVIMLNVAVIQQ